MGQKRRLDSRPFSSGPPRLSDRLSACHFARVSEGTIAKSSDEWADRVRLIDAKCAGRLELPVLGAVTAPDAVLIRPDGYVACVGERTRLGLADALTNWFDPPAAA